MSLLRAALVEISQLLLRMPASLSSRRSQIGPRASSPKCMVDSSPLSSNTAAREVATSSESSENNESIETCILKERAASEAAVSGWGWCARCGGGAASEESREANNAGQRSSRCGTRRHNRLLPAAFSSSRVQLREVLPPFLQLCNCLLLFSVIL